MVNADTITTTTSILRSTKKALGLSDDYTVFDVDVIMHINTVFAFLNQLGVGPEEGFSIEDDTAVWEDFTTDVRLNAVKSYVYLRVKLLFDPPATSFAISAFEKQVSEMEWRLNMSYETYTNPNDPLITDIIDGGTPTA